MFTIRTFLDSGVDELSEESRDFLSSITDSCHPLSEEQEYQKACELKRVRQLAETYAAALRESDLDPSARSLYEQEYNQAVATREALAFDLFRANLRWAIKLTYTSTRLEFMDRFTYASIGLWHAIERYDPDRLSHGKPIRISTFSTYDIRKAMPRGADNEECLIRLPAHVHDECKRIRRHRAAYIRVYGSEPSVDELAAACNVSKAHIQFVESVSRTPISLYSGYGGAGGEGRQGNLDDIIASPSNLEEEVIERDMRTYRAACVRAALERMENYTILRGNLPYKPYKRYVDVLRLRYRIGEQGARGNEPEERTLEQVGRLLDGTVTRERSRVMHGDAIEWLRTHDSDLRAVFMEWNGATCDS